MNVGLLGYSGSGKTSLVAFLSGKRHESFDPLKPSVVTVKISDSRLKVLAEMAEAQKITESEINFIDIKGSPESVGFDEKIIEIALQSDVIAFVIGAFSEQKNPCDELDSLYLEMIFRDDERLKNIMEKRQQEILQGKRNKNEQEELLRKYKTFLEQERFLFSMNLDEKERVFLASLGMITIKRIFVIANGARMKKQIEEKCKNYNLELCQIDVENHSTEAVEEFWSQFLKAAGLLRFYTVGRKETKAWLLPEGATLLDAAAAIHTDIAKGFVRADVVSYEDFISAGSLSVCREKGLLRSEGKTGLAKDGDIVHIHSTI
ncbi:MAG TPA: DUF933 domain-containing protein [bacterium]|nr:DUF933 domain-containing protein [bacterium]